MFRHLAYLCKTLVCLATIFGYLGTLGSSPISASSPAQWPSSPGLAPEIEGWPNAVRFYGEDRNQTNLAASLALRGGGRFPFADPDSTSDGAPNLAAAQGWWGLNACPRSVILVAGDVSADAIVASSLSDPTGESREPYLRRSAAADPLFDPIGGFERVDTDLAPILVTGSARQGIQGLSTSTLVAVQDLRSGGCNAARQAIIVGGPTAISNEAEIQLLEAGITEVFRVQGADRFATAAAVATSLGTEAAPIGVTRCSDPIAGDQTARMKFYANAVVEWRPSASECQLLGRTLVLADGRTGADAMAAGWWTSFWQVPVVLHDGSNRLPDATVMALQTIEVDNLIVLGGSKALSSVVVREATTLTGAAARRVAGADRYGTSVEMAKQFGGWYPTGSAASYDSAMLCLAASSGHGASSLGWPDALAAGTWCGAASGAAQNPRPPQRLLTPLRGKAPRDTARPARPARDAVPVLLVAPGDKRLPLVVEDFLTDLFEPADLWCSSVVAPLGCAMPGFVVAFGGHTSISDEVMGSVSSAVSGGTATSRTPNEPVIGGAFVTELALTGYHHSGTGGQAFCLPRNGYADTRWLIAGVDGDERPSAQTDVALDKWYWQDVDGVASSVAEAKPGCLHLPANNASKAWLTGVSPEGRRSSRFDTAIGSASEMKLLRSLTSNRPALHAGVSMSEDPEYGGNTELVFISEQASVGLLMNSKAAVIYTGTLSLTLTRGYGSDGIDRFTAQWALSTTSGTVDGEAWGEAQFDGVSWHLSGISEIRGGSWTEMTGKGGFQATIDTKTIIANDDAVEWQVDGYGLQ